jgi:MoxR-like ATPase
MAAKVKRSKAEMAAELTNGAIGRPASPRDKVLHAAAALKADLIERDVEVELMLTALVAGEHCLLVGPPGTAKSMLSDAVASLIGGSRFSVLISKFTTPEEVFGPVSVRGLKEDRYVRVTAGKLPEAEVAFIDEVFKASSAILNTMLKVLNERTYDAGDGVVRGCPLRICLAASNEWPAEREELGALFDRFLIRKTVRPVRTPAGRERLLFGSVGGSALPTLSAAELDRARSEAAALPFSGEARGALLELLAELAREGVVPGDRRQRKAVGVARAAAWLAGRSEVKPADLRPLGYVLWDDPASEQKCQETVLKVACPVLWRVGQATAEAEQVLEGLDRRDLAAVTAAVAKLQEIGKTRLHDLAGDPDGDRARAWLWAEIKALRAASVDSVLGGM